MSAFTIKSHCLVEAVQCPSPNHNARPPKAVPELLVIHNISLPPGQFGGGNVQRFFCNHLDAAEHPFFAEIDGLEVSAHLLIERDGTVTQFVPFDRRAWHAGVSCYQGRDGCNDFSIGIELEGTDELPYTETQYRVLSAVIKVLLNSYSTLSTADIVGHNDIAPGRKTDPGPVFDWDRLQRLLS